MKVYLICDDEDKVVAAYINEKDADLFIKEKPPWTHYSKEIEVRDSIIELFETKPD
jgi:hypothetical protein